MTPYINRPGELCYAPPLDIENVKFYSWVVPIDASVAQRKILDPCLNFAFDTQRFVASLPFILVTFTYLEKVKPLSKEYANRGWFPEVECAIWFLIEDKVDRQFKFFHPYMFVDNVWAMVMGREIFGFNKSIATFDSPQNLSQPDHFAMSTLVLKTFSPETEGAPLELIAARRPQDAPWPTPVKEFESGAEALVKTFERLGPSFLKDGLADIHLIESLSKGLCPMVFLKQFRDGVDVDTACWQQILELECKVNSFSGGGFLPQDFTIFIEDAASHPIRQQFGLPEGPIQPILGTWTEFGFLVNSAKELWRSNS